MRNKIIRMNLNMDEKENTKVEANGSLRGRGLIMHMGSKTWHCKRSLMHLDRDMGHNSNNSSIEVRVLVDWSVGHVVRNTLGEIVHSINVEGLRYIVHKRHIMLGILVKVFHVYMQ